MDKNSKFMILLIAVLISFLCGSYGTYFAINNSFIKSNIVNTILGETVKLEEDNSIEEAVGKIYDATVVIEGFKKDKLVSTGTGFIYKKKDKEAFIMTNHHVINDCEKVKIILSDKSEVDAKIKGSESYSDVAVLSVSSEKIKKVATLGNNTDSKVGDTVFTVGSPEGSKFAGTVTKGIKSGHDRLVAVSLENTNSADYYMKVLQTDAAINPGNSGGPICNIEGKVIGITNMKLVDNTVEGMGFAIPIEDALNYAEVFEKGEKYIRPYIGISMLDVNDERSLYEQQIMIKDNVSSGVVIIEALKDSPAAKAGLTKGDIIVKIDKKNISSIAEFRYELYKYKADDKIKIKYLHDGKYKTTTVTLSKKD